MIKVWECSTSAGVKNGKVKEYPNLETCIRELTGKHEENNKEFVVSLPDKFDIEFNDVPEDTIIVEYYDTWRE